MDTNYFINLIASAPMQNSSRYFEAGTYHVEIDAAKMFMNRKRQPRVAVDCTVIDSNNPNLSKMTSVSWVVSLDSDSGPSTVRTFIRDLMGCQDHEVTADVLGKVFIDSDNPANRDARSLVTSLQAIVNVYEKQTKSGGVFTRCDWKRFDPKESTAIDFSSIPLPSSSNANHTSAHQAVDTTDAWAGTSPNVSSQSGWGSTD